MYETYLNAEHSSCLARVVAVVKVEKGRRGNCFVPLLTVIGSHRYYERSYKPAGSRTVICGFAQCIDGPEFSARDVVPPPTRHTLRR